MRNFNATLFREETSLITPSNEHFPGRADSVAGMAEIIFKNVQTYAGLRHWPCRVVDMTRAHEDQPINLAILGSARGANAVLPAEAAALPPLLIPYNPHQVGEPEALIASFVHVLAYYLAMTCEEPPPGGEEYRAHATELLGIFMGFGIMFANSAYTFKRGCGSCYNPFAERSAALNQDEATYALAMFCRLKNIPNKQVLPHLKKYLRPIYKRAARELETGNWSIET